jgi:hypothetical protein
MDDLIENALRIMVFLARLPTLAPTSVEQILGVRLDALRPGAYRIAKLDDTSRVPQEIVLLGETICALWSASI